ncbi:MAG: hypothetical protein HDS43_05215 [Bacteroides sp.]|nr:hypothetical protein [Bacteroides sp.]
MKKLMICALLAAGFVMSAQAKDIYAHDASVLPKAAQTTLANNLKSKVSVVKIDKDFGRVDEYEVVMTDGVVVTFDRDGNWKEVETNNRSSVPSAFVPKGISTYVAKNHRGAKIVGLEKERNGYDVELSDGVDIKFNAKGEFVKYD